MFATMHHFSSSCHRWLIMALFLVATGCAGPQVVHTPVAGPVPKAVLEEKILQEIPGPRPEWVDRIPQATADNLFFVGQSGTQVEERDARNDALRDAVNQFARYCGVDVQVVDEYLSVAVAKASGVVDPTLTQTRTERQASDAFVSRVKSQEWYSRRLQRSLGETVLERGWQAWTLVTVPTGEMAQVQEYQKKRKARAEAERIAPFLQRYAQVVKLYATAKELERAGRPLASVEAYGEALAAYEAVMAMPGFDGAVLALKETGLEHPLPIESDLRTLLAGLKVAGRTSPQRLLPGSPLEQELVVAVEHQQQPVVGATIVFSGEEGAVRRTTDSAGTASYHPAGSESWGAGNRTYTARLEHPALERAASRFSVPQPVQFIVDVRALSEAEREERNRGHLQQMAGRLAKVTRDRLGSGKVPGIAVLPGRENDESNELGALVAQALEAALTREDGISVVSSSEALHGIAPGMESGGSSTRAAAVVLSRYRISGDTVMLDARLVQLSPATVITAEESRLWLTDSWTAARQAPPSRAIEVPFTANFLYYPPNSRPQSIENGMTLRSGHRYQVNFEPAATAHLYAYQIDSSGVTYPLFPNPDFSAQTNPVPARQMVVLPSAPGTFLELDNVSGTEELVVVASREPLPQIQGIWESLLAGQHLTAEGTSEGRRELRVDVNRQTLELALEILNNPAVGTVHRVKFLHQ